MAQEGPRKILKTMTEKSQNSHKIDFSLYNVNSENGVDLIRQFLQEYPAMMPIVLIMKQLIYLAQLNEAAKGGIPSYPLVLLIASYFQAKAINGSIFSTEFPSFGIAFVDFLHFFSSLKLGKLDVMVKTTALRVGSPPLQTRNSPVPHQMDRLLEESGLKITDPFSESNNITQNMHKHAYLESLFYCLFVSIHQKDGEQPLTRAFRTAKYFQRMNNDSKFK